MFFQLWIADKIGTNQLSLKPNCVRNINRFNWRAFPNKAPKSQTCFRSDPDQTLIGSLYHAHTSSVNNFLMSSVYRQLRWSWEMDKLPNEQVNHFHEKILTAVKRYYTDWYEIWTLTDHEIYYIKIELDLRKLSNGPFSETEKGFWVIPTPGGSQCTGVSPTLLWKWPRATLSPYLGPFFERNHSFRVKMVSQNVPKTSKSCPSAWYPAWKKKIYIPCKRSYIPGHICELFHFALSLLNWEIAITSERVARLTWFFGFMPKIIICDHLI